MTLPTQKFIAPTETCFRHFMSEHPQLDATELLAEFCLPKAKGAVTSVQAWQRGSVTFPRGEALLRLRCFLTLAGYEVEEFSQLEGIVRQLAMMISMDRITPFDAAAKLGFDSVNRLHSLWQITHGKRSFTTDTREALVKLLRRRSSKVDTEMEAWQKRITAISGEAPVVSFEEQKSDLQNVMPAIAVGFGRLVTTLTPMADALLKADQQQAVRDATRDGASIDELIKMLTDLRESL